MCQYFMQVFACTIKCRAVDVSIILKLLCTTLFRIYIHICRILTCIHIQNIHFHIQIKNITYKSRTSDLTSHFCVSCLCRKSTTLYSTYIHIHRKLTYLQHRIYSCEKDDDTGWRRLIGSPKLQIIFHKRATKYRSLLRKMTYKDKGSYESSPPCTQKYDVMSCVLNVYVNMNILYMSICQYSIYEYVRTGKSRAVAGKTMTHNNVM